MDSLINWLVDLGIDPGWAPLLPILAIGAALVAVETVILRAAVRRRRMTRKAAAFWAFVSPWAFGFLAFTLGPMAYSLYLSFTSWDVVSPPSFVGIENYRAAFFDPLVYRALGVTFEYVLLTVPLQVILSFLIGVLLNRPVRGISFIRTSWYLPALVTGVPQATLMIALFRPENGVINDLLAKIGVHGPDWLYSSAWAVPTVALMSLWTVGGNMIIYLAALKDIPPELYDAAAVDGAGLIRSMWSVTVPQMSPILLFNLLTGMIGALQIFTQGFVATGGSVSASALGPDNSLLFFVFYLFNVAFSTFRLGYASALAWILFVIIMILTALTFRASRGAIYYEGAQETLTKRRRHQSRIRV